MGIVRVRIAGLEQRALGKLLVCEKGGKIGHLGQNPGIFLIILTVFAIDTGHNCYKAGNVLDRGLGLNNMTGWCVLEASLLPKK